MEAKFIGLLSFISMVFVINGQTADILRAPFDNLSEQDLESAIYYGDSNVNIGEPFEITCIISISEPINWVKDGEPITKHNLRHWRDEHSFITSEGPIDGEKHKIEAQISVRHALKAHQGRYQCNSLHTSYHMLKVHTIEPNEHSFTRLHGIDSSDISISSPLPESYVPSPTDLFTVSNTVHQGKAHTSTPSISSQTNTVPLEFVYSNATEFNKMYTIPDEVPSITWRGTTNTDHERHRNVFDKPNITGVLLVHPSSFPVSPEYVQMITGRVIEQPTPTEPISTRQYYLPVLPPGPTSYNNPATANIPKSITNEPELLVPNYDNVENRLKAFSIRLPLVLSCNITKEGEYELIWEKNGTEVSKVPFLQGRYRIIKPERKFIIEKTDEKDAGTYSCRVNSEKKDFIVAANVVVRVPSNTGVVEGEKLSIHCIVVGTDPKLYWETGNLTMYNSTGRYVLIEDENHVQNAVLTMENTSLDDRGEYKCLARNILTDLNISEAASDVSYVRVKGRLAALWPFLGICAEVLILCTIILIYEKRRNKTELEESDTDPNTEQ